MNLLNRKALKMPVARNTLPVEVAVQSGSSVAPANPARQKRAQLARQAEAQWLESEAMIEQLTTERDAERNRADAAEVLNDRLLQREAALEQRLDQQRETALADKRQEIEVLAAVKTQFAAAVKLLCECHRAIGALDKGRPSVDLQALAEQIQSDYPLPAVVGQGPSSNGPDNAA